MLLLCDKWGSEYVEYFYDASGSPYALSYFNGTAATKYYFVKNVEGDILELRTENNALAAKYVYDCWGRLLEVRDAGGNPITSTTHIANLNILRYRGYVYDAETKLYYLESRYYDPQTQRFISPDSFDYLGYNGDIAGYNMYAYCGNNPVVRADYNGKIWKIIILVITIVIVSLTISGSNQKVSAPDVVIQYDVPCYNQGSRSLCGVYCQVMIESYRNGETLSKKQADKRAKEIAIAVNGKDNWDVGTWPTNINLKNITHVYSITELYDCLEENGPVYAYYCNSKTKSAHLVVVTGVNLTKGLVFTNNPWGVKGTQSWAQFKKGVAKKWYMSDKGMTFQYVIPIND